MRNKILLGIILIAILTRLPNLAEYPSGFSGDEAQQGYSAYSILKTSQDEWGQFLPVNPRGFGDYKPPLYTYLTIPSIAIFGLNEFAVRLPAALMGIGVVITIFFLTRRLFDQKTAFWAAFLLSINPWHIGLSRTAFEGGAGILLFSLSLLFYLKAETNKKYLILTAIFGGLTLYSYHAFRVFLLLYMIGIFFIKKQRDFIFKNKNYLALLIFATFLVPLILNIQTTLTRASDVGITSDQVLEGYFKNRGTSPLPGLIDKSFDNKFLYLSNLFLENYLSYYSPTFYFTGNRPDNSYLNFPGFELLYKVEIIFWLFALYWFFLGKDGKRSLVILWLIVATIPAALAQGSMQANRALTLLPLVSIISAIGVIALTIFLSKIISNKKNRLDIFIAGVLLISLLFFLRHYFIKSPQNPNMSLRPEYKIVFNKILEVQSNYNHIIISKVFTEPQIFVAFYSKMDPLSFQQASQDWLRYEKSNKLYVDQLESWNMGKFLFEGINWRDKDSKRENALIVGEASDFPEAADSILDIKNNKGEITYRLVPTKNAE